MTVEKLVAQLKDKHQTIVIMDERRKREIYRGEASGAVSLGYGPYHIRWIGPNGLIWYW